MKYVYLILLVVISALIMFGFLLPELISEKDTVTVVVGFVLMIAWCLGLLHLAFKLTTPNYEHPSKTNQKPVNKEKSNEK